MPQDNKKRSKKDTQTNKWCPRKIGAQLFLCWKHPGTIDDDWSLRLSCRLRQLKSTQPRGKEEVADDDPDKRAWPFPTLVLL